MKLLDVYSESCPRLQSILICTTENGGSGCGGVVGEGGGGAVLKDCAKHFILMHMHSLLSFSMFLFVGCFCFVVVVCLGHCLFACIFVSFFLPVFLSFFLLIISFSSLFHLFSFCCCCCFPSLLSFFSSVSSVCVCT